MNDQQTEPNNRSAVGSAPESIEEDRYDGTLSAEELAKILSLHELWLSSKGASGERADLTSRVLAGTHLRERVLRQAILERADLAFANLQGANLTEANLAGACLTSAELHGALLKGANLEQADLENAKLSGVNLSEAKLDGATLRLADFENRQANDGHPFSFDLPSANLTNADLRNTDLRDAKLAHVSGLLPDRLGGANLSNAKVPAKIARFEGLKQVEEASNNARKIWLTLLSGCLYAWLTIGTTKDASLLTNSGTSPLPIIQAEVPIAGFYVVAPLVLLCLYFYQHLYLQRIWEELATLPAVFPDGKALDQKVYPWLLLGLVRAHSRNLRDERPALSHLQNAISVFLAWWVVPLTLFAFWVRYLPRHDWKGTIALIVYILIGVWSGIAFYRRARVTLRGKETGDISENPAYEFLAVLVVAIATASIADIAYKGETAITVMGFSPYANLATTDVSTKPASWTEQQGLGSVKGPDLEGANLRFAVAYSAFLARANLQRADLQRANLESANLEGAILVGADLSHVDLSWANLKGTEARRANFEGAHLLSTNLEGADLTRVNLAGAFFHRANFKDAELVYANLKDANLLGAHLEGVTLVAANLEGSTLAWTNLNGVNLSYANLSNTDLRYADLGAADLSHAKVGGADLIGANLRWADLRFASGLDCRSIQAGRGWEFTFRDRDCGAPVP